MPEATKAQGPDKPEEPDVMKEFEEILVRETFYVVSLCMTEEQLAANPGLPGRLRNLISRRMEQLSAKIVSGTFAAAAKTSMLVADRAIFLGGNPEPILKSVEEAMKVTFGHELAFIKVRREGDGQEQRG
jgi:hypothetical protein